MKGACLETSLACPFLLILFFVGDAKALKLLAN